MSKWVIITIAAVLLAVSITVVTLILALKNTNADEQASDESFLKQKEDLLRNAVKQTLTSASNIVQVESSKILNLVKTGGYIANTSNNTLQTQITGQQNMIDTLNAQYTAELKNIQKTS